MAITANLGISLVEQSQAQKEVTVNEAIVILDSTIGGGVIDKNLSTPPISPSEGDRYLVDATSTSDWTGKEDNIAYYLNNAWNFIAPTEGLQIWVNDENIFYVYDGFNWNAVNKILTTIAPKTLTISAGIVNVTASSNFIDTESATASDDLDTINGGTDGNFLYLSAANSAHTVVFKNKTGNLHLAGDFIADNIDDILVLQYRGGNWVEISRSNNGV